VIKKIFKFYFFGPVTFGTGAVVVPTTPTTWRVQPEREPPKEWEVPGGRWALENGAMASTSNDVDIVKTGYRRSMLTTDA